jgi:hypothetical protein
MGTSVTVNYQVTAIEAKYFCITVTAAQAYKALHPELALDLEVIQGMPGGCHILRRGESRTVESIVYA